jgi:NAD(P)H-hydrate epimerase
MVHPVNSFREALDKNVDAIGIGPGLGKSRSEEILGVVKDALVPMVVDADALNILSTRLHVINSCRGPRLLTPHPGEMGRLYSTANRSRAEVVRAFTNEFPVTLLLKGSRTIVSEQHRPLAYNTTGSPGMATGGMGDVLTGVCAALAGQGLSLYDAARLGAWVCGRAAELAIFNGPKSEESLAAGDLFETLGTAFRQLRENSL